MNLIVMYRARGALVTLALTVSLASGLSSCARSAANQPAPPPSTPTAAASPVVPSSTASSTQPPPSPESKARRDVIALVREYYSTEEAVATNRRVPLKRYYDVAAGDYVQILLQNAQARRAKDQRVTGRVKLSQSKIEKLDISPRNGRVPTGTVRTCIDVSAVDVVDKQGKSVVGSGRANAYTELLTVKKLTYGWRVVDGENAETARCDD